MAPTLPVPEGEVSALTLLMRASVDLEQLLFTALKPLIMQAAARDVRLLVDAVADFPKTVQVDGLKLAWAATALVGNALRFVRTGSTLMRSMAAKSVV